MNREIKFRAWDESIEKIINCGDDRRWGSITNHYLFRNFHDDVLMQYTGLKDTNGTEIYEGDLVSVDLYEYAGVNETNEHVIGDNSGNTNFFADVAYLKGMKSEHIEVIGNIYENPELINE